MTSLLTSTFANYLYPFIGVLIAACLFVRRYDLTSSIARIHGLLQKSGFSTNDNLASEIARLELLRVATGLILCHRTLYTLLYMGAETTTGLDWALAWIVMLLGIAFTSGIYTSISGFLLLLFLQPFDYALRTSTLGTDVLQMILLTLVFAPVGTAFSLDALLRRRGGRLSAPLAVTDRWFGLPSIPRISVLRCLSLLSYGMLCIYSVLFHLTDSAWMEGYANALLLSSSYLSYHFPLFRSLFETYPEVSLRAAEYSLYAMMLWESLLLPMVFLHRITRVIVIVWGLLFFLVSTFFLQLGWLPYYEYVLWAMLFWQAWWLNPRGRSTIKLLYDDRCNLCDRTVRILSRVDLFGVIRFHPLSENSELLEEQGIDPQEALQDLYGVDDTHARLYKGYDLYATLTARLLLLAPAWPVMAIGRLVYIGPLIYQWIARRRIELFGVCEIPAKLGKSIQATIAARATTGKSLRESGLFPAMLITYAVFLVVFVIRLPHVKDLQGVSQVSPYVAKYFKGAYETVGLAPINVFNAADLKLSETYFTIERLGPTGDWVMLPLTGPLGERLEWHESDRLYFGNSLRYRRSSEDKTCFASWQQDLIQEIIALDKERAETSPRLYRLRYFHQPLPKFEELKRYQFHQPGSKMTCEVEYDPDTHEVRSIVYR